MKWINIYRDKDGRFISDADFDNYKQAFEEKDGLTTYVETVAILRNNESYQPQGEMDGVKFHIWLQEEGYEFSEARNCVYLGGKNYWIWEVYKKYKGLQIEESEQDELWREIKAISNKHHIGGWAGRFFAELKSKYHLIKK